MRNIIEVCNDLIEMFDSLAAKEDIECVIKNVGYTAPEAMHLRWNQLQGAVFNNLPESEKLWSDKQIQIVSKFSTVPFEEIKAEIASR